MQQKGTLSSWDDKKGFGFITPSSGGQRAFVHISAFPRSRRPKINETLEFTLTHDARGRPRAEHVTYLVSGSRRSRRSGRVTPALITVAAFFSMLAAAVYLDFLPWIVVAAYAMTSVVSLVLYGIDKSAAEKGDRRTSEGTLHLFDFVGGWPGALIAQQGFRHKTSKQPFQRIYKFLVAGNLGVLLWLFGTDQGASWLSTLGIPVS